MKRLISIIVVITVVLCTVIQSYADSDINSICKIQISSGSPYISEHEKLDYTTTNLNEIAFIVHYFNSLEFIEEQVYTSSDGESIYVQMEYTNGTSCYFSVYPSDSSISKKSAHLISIPMQEYDRICSVIHALKTDQILLPDEVTFEPLIINTQKMKYCQKMTYEDIIEALGELATEKIIVFPAQVKLSVIIGHNINTK